MRKYLIASILFASFGLQAQINVAVGYSLGYTPAKIHNSMVTDFNTVFENETYKGDQMPELHFLHGLSLGARWKYELVSLEFNWENLSRTREAIGEDNLDALFRKTVFYAMNNYSIGMESHFGALGLGVAVGTRSVKIKEEIANTDRKVDILSQNQYFIKPFFSFNFSGGEMVSLAIKPYMSIPLGKINLGALATELTNDQHTVTPPLEDESFWFYGVTFVFYNGFQK